MKTFWLGLLMTALAVTLTPDAMAKRLGGGKSMGMQRDMPARTAPDAPAGKPAAPQAPQGTQAPAQQAAPATAAQPAAAAAAAAPKRNWLGPIAGLAAGLGLAALFSHLGMGEGFANFVMLLLLALVAFVVIRMVMRRFAPQPAAAMQRSGGVPGGEVAWPAPGGSGTTSTSAPVTPEAVTERVAAPSHPKAFVPAAFDSESFERVAKMIFIRLQAANDARDLDDLRSFTTPEMFAELSLDIQERGAGAQRTEVIAVDVKVLDVVQEGERQIVSVRYSGQVREQAGAEPVTFNEVWHLTKPVDDSRSWAIAGIEQMN